MGRFEEAFGAYGGDYKITMERFMGNEALYIRLLGMLFQDENLDLLGRALDSGDLSGAFSAAHTLKGVAANLGLTPLYKAVGAMVEPLRTGEPRTDYPLMYQTVTAEFQRARELWKLLKEGETM